jgi:large subunit ribosomal protein L5
MASKVITLKEKYQKEILPELQKRLKIKNINAVPKLQKVVVNVGIGKMLEGGKDYSEIAENISMITGQKPVVAKAKKSISNFKIRKGMPIGIYVTLRGNSMYDFINKLVNITLPRTRDFRGISHKSFDGHGNYSLPIKEHTVFPEINPDDLTKVHGMQITVVTTAKDDDQAYELLKALGFPLQAKPTKANAK